MSPPSEATASATPNVDTDSQATADNMSQETAPVNPLIDSEGHVQPIRLARNSDHVESATYGQDSAELSGTTTRASPAEERLGETSILGRSADSRPAPNSRPDFVHLGSTLFERYVEYGSSRLPSEDQDEEETTKSEDMENETDPNRLHDYIHELKKKMSEIQGNCDRAVSELSKYDRGHSVEESWMRDRLVAIRQSLQACSYRMSDWSTLRANWSSVNKFLRSNDCVFLSANQIPGPGIFAQMESELLMFAFASALWKVLFDPMLLGATPVECSILRKLEVGIKGVSPPMRQSYLLPTALTTNHC